jgi:hypothetical protein
MKDGIAIAADLVNALQGRNGPTLTIEAILDGLVRHLGGVDEFCKQLALDYMKARPGSPTRQRIGQLIGNLTIAYARVKEPSSTNWEDVPTEDLERVIAESLRKYVLQSERPNAATIDEPSP